MWQTNGRKCFALLPTLTVAHKMRQQDDIFVMQWAFLGLRTAHHRAIDEQHTVQQFLGPRVAVATIVVVCVLLALLDDIANLVALCARQLQRIIRAKQIRGRGVGVMHEFVQQHIIGGTENRAHIKLRRLIECFLEKIRECHHNETVQIAHRVTKLLNALRGTSDTEEIQWTNYEVNEFDAVISEKGANIVLRQNVDTLHIGWKE
mmetsp:Transcript_58157/g.96428  ORF Transcript_58157/g.96428 Transcript_58157/m.96428 type:complete len:205 (-) Transcript_58157:687-1301(-)